MSWSNASASRLELSTTDPQLRVLVVIIAALLVIAVVWASVLPLAALVLLPLICGWLWFRLGAGVERVVLLASDSDQVSVDQHSFTLANHAAVAALIGLRLQDGKGMRMDVLFAPWNSRAEDRRQLRLWLARHGSGDTR